MEASAVVHPRFAELDQAEPRLTERRIAWVFAGTGVAVFAAMGLIGLTMRMAQGDVIDLSPTWFYRLMTLHGAGMLTGALLAMMGALWFVVRGSVPLSLERMLASFVLILVGAGGVIVATLIMVFIFALGSYLLPQLLGRPQHWTLSVLITDQAIYQSNMPFAAAMAVFLVLVTLGLVALTVIVGRRGEAA